MADEMEYLQPSFDPSSITMPKLRNILMTHDVKYPASAKKPELVDIFNQQVKPKSRRLLAARDRVRRTSEGITYVPSSQESSTEGDEDRGSMPPPPIPDTPRQRKPRTSARASSDDKSSEPSSRRSTPLGRRASSKHPRQSDTDPETELPRPSATKSRKSGNTPRIRVEEPDEIPRRPRMPETVFSDENPFQSGGSPPTIEADRRRSAGSSNDRKRNSSSRRRTDGAFSTGARLGQKSDVVVPTSKTFEVPMPRLKASQTKQEPSDELEPGEDFTIEEQEELAKEQISKGTQSSVSPSNRKQRSQKSNNAPKALPWMVLVTLLGGYATWYRQEKLLVGYCGIGHPSEALSSVQIPEWADSFRPICEPCPQHATCYENLETKCDKNFLLQHHPLSLGGLVPLPPTCEPDGDKARKIKAVADRAVEKLRERNAQAECGTLKDQDGKAETSDIPEKRLKQEIGKQKRRGMTETEFEDLWKGALEEIVGREEVIQGGQSPEG